MRHIVRATLSSFALLLSACAPKDSSPIRTTSTGETAVSPAADSVASRGHSLVRIVNAVSTGNSISVQLGDRTLFRELAAGAVTAYSEVETNLAQFSVLAAGAPNGSMLAQADRVLIDGNRYTVFVISQDVSQQALRIVRDDVIPDSGMARIRLIHAAPGGPDLDVRPVGTTDRLFIGVDFLGEAGPKDIAPTPALVLELRAASQSSLLMKLPPVELRRGTATTIVVTGNTKLASFHFTDAMMKQTPKP